MTGAVEIQLTIIGGCSTIITILLGAILNYFRSINKELKNITISSALYKERLENHASQLRDLWNKIDKK